MNDNNRLLPWSKQPPYLPEVHSRLSAYRHWPALAEPVDRPQLCQPCKAVVVVVSLPRRSLLLLYILLTLNDIV